MGSSCRTTGEMLDACSIFRVNKYRGTYVGNSNNLHVRSIVTQTPPSFEKENLPLSEYGSAVKRCCVPLFRDRVTGFIFTLR